MYYKSSRLTLGTKCVPNGDNGKVSDDIVPKKFQSVHPQDSDRRPWTVYLITSTDGDVVVAA